MKYADVELIQRFLAGDENAFTELVRKYQKPVHALAWRKIGDFHIAEEITQDTFMKVYQNLHTLKEPNQFAGWLYVIATRQCYAWLRKKRIRTQPLEDTETTMGQRDAYSRHVTEAREKTVVEAQREMVKNLLAKLKESERTVMTLYYLGEMTVEEIGRFLGVSAGTIKSRLQRARHRLKEEETMIREALENFQITPNLTENIMREVARLKPAAPSANKPLVPWAIAASTVAVIFLMLGIGNQHMSRFQRPYSFEAISKMTVDLIETPVVLNLEAKPDIRTQLGDSAVSSKNDGSGQRPDDVLFAAQAEGEDVSVPKQKWIQAEPVEGSDVGGLFVTDDGELYTVTYEHIYKMGSGGKAWQQIADMEALGTDYMGSALIEEWDNTLYMVVSTTLIASKDDGKTWELVYTFPIDYGYFAFDLELTAQTFYIIFSDYTAFRSEDMGRTWQAVKAGFPARPSFMVAIQDTLFAGTDKGLYCLKSDNWQRVEFPVSVPIKILSAAVTKDCLYVMARVDRVVGLQEAPEETKPTWWIFRSTDLGDSWADITPTNAWPVNWVPPNLKLIAAGETLLAMENGMVRSTDGGDTWLPPQLPGTSPSMDTLNPAVVVNENTIYVGSSKGLYRSTDAGISWTPVNIKRQNWKGLYNLIAYKGQNMPTTLYAMFGDKIVQTTNKGKSWKTILMETPMTAPVREELPSFRQIREFGGTLYTKAMGDHRPGNTHKASLYRISTDSRTAMPIQGMPIFDSRELSELWNKGRTGALDVSDKSFLEQLKANFVGADQFFKTLARGGTFRQAELYGQALYQDQYRLIRRGLSGAFAVSGNTFYVEYNFKLFRWGPGEIAWYDTGVQETGELIYLEAMKAFEAEGLSAEKIDEILDSWMEFKLAVSRNTVYVGKRDGHLVASFDGGTNWLNLTPALPFSAKAFKDIVFVGATVYVATDEGVAASDNGKQWRAITNAAGTRLNMEDMAVAEGTLYGLTKDTGIYRLESGVWEQVVSKIPDHVETFAVDGNTVYVSTRDSNMLHFSLEK